MSTHRSRTSGNVVVFEREIEFTWTADVRIDRLDGSWETRLSPPAGTGWVVADGSHERRTQWRRIRRRRP